MTYGDEGVMWETREGRASPVRAPASHPDCGLWCWQPFYFVGEGNKCQRRGISDRYSLTSFSAEQVGMQPMPSLDEMLQVLSLSIDEYMDIVAEHLLFTDDVDTESGAPKCSVRTCPPQPTARPSLHHLPGPHNPASKTCWG
ncbi:hypothetical protein O3P69_009560 [Scylla paramamosain]|uniref:Uncharacterized protein n=1 Tax=Scylla paramamosain TaxID=85552 RepID=A0AAW0SV14_SCYPA